MADDQEKQPSQQQQQAADSAALRAEEVKDVYTTLCSLMTGNGDCPQSRQQQCPSPSASEQACFDGRSDCFKSCPKQLQLPMFLSKTFHMIDRCDDEIAGWSEQGDSFVVKNVDRFAASVLPLYFKHSNFSSFARQLNFYGFRKLRSEGILTAMADPQTACHVRFYHSHFQRDKPELLSEIRRATKTDQQSKDDLDALKQELKTLKHTLAVTTSEYDRRLAEMAYDFNRRLGAANAEVEKLAALVRQRIPATQTGDGAVVTASSAAAPFPNAVSSDLTAAVAAAASTILSSSSSAAAAATASDPPPTQRSQANLLHSLSQVAAVHALQQQIQQQRDLVNPPTTDSEDKKRPAETNGGSDQSAKQPRLSDSV